MDRKTKVKVSSFMTKILRHSPADFRVNVDEKGFADIEELLTGMKKDNRWNSINRETIEEITATSEKQRFEIKGNKIRARYGHSFPVIQEKSDRTLPAFLYHGTSEEKLFPIIEKKEGILPMTRNFVHLSETRHFATLAAKRRRDPRLLKIDTNRAIECGTVFQFAGNEVWLSTDIAVFAIIQSEKI